MVEDVMCGRALQAKPDGVGAEGVVSSDAETREQDGPYGSIVVALSSSRRGLSLRRPFCVPAGLAHTTIGRLNAAIACAGFTEATSCIGEQRGPKCCGQPLVVCKAERRHSACS